MGACHGGGSITGSRGASPVVYTTMWDIPQSHNPERLDGWEPEVLNLIQWNLDNSNCRGPPKSLSYEKFELWIMLSLCFGHVPTVLSPFCSSVFHFLAKLSKICEIFFSYEKKTMKLSLLHKNVNTISHRKGNLVALTTVYQLSYD